MKVRWKVTALNDLKAIRKFYFDNKAENFADLITDNIFETTHRLESHPFSGRKIPEINNSNLREVITSNYRIMYHVDESVQVVEILTIIQATQQFGPIGLS